MNAPKAWQCDHRVTLPPCKAGLGFIYAKRIDWLALDEVLNHDVGDISLANVPIVHLVGPNSHRNAGFALRQTSCGDQFDLGK